MIGPKWKIEPFARRLENGEGGDIGDAGGLTSQEFILANRPFQRVENFGHMSGHDCCELA